MAKKLETWKLTQKQFLKSQEGTIYKDFIGRKVTVRFDETPGGIANLRTLKYSHEARVKAALEQGEKISPKVLKDYPNLKQVKEGEWKTIHGAHVFIEKGKTLEQAMGHKKGTGNQRKINP